MAGARDTDLDGRTPPEPPPLEAARDALFLDFDGTLAEIAPTPDSAGLTPAMVAALTTAAARIGEAIAIVSGRDVATLARLVPVDALRLVGIHGLEERRPDGRIARPAPAAGLAEARRRLERLAARERGLLLEDKGLSLALHYRNAPGLAAIAHAEAHRLARSLGLALQTGKMVVELRTPGADKGAAVARLMDEPAFRSRRPLFVGDDDTDESAFRAVAARGGLAIRVGRIPARSAATHALPDVAAVERWLAA